jgi:hypothetical protein
VDFSYCDRISQKSLTTFFESIRDNNFSTVEFIAGGCGRLKSEAIKALAANLEEYVYLTKLTLDFESCVEITPDSLKHLSYALGKKKKLRSLHLNFTKCNEAVDENALNVFSDNICEDIGALASLKMRLDYLYRNNDRSMAKLAKLFNRNAGSLQTFAISIAENNQLTDSGIFSIYDTIKRLKKIRNLEVEVKKLPKLTDKGATILAEALSKQTKLETLLLDISECPAITDEGVSWFGKAFSHLTALQSLRFLIKGGETNSITSKGLDDISTGLKEIENLNSLEIAVECCSAISTGDVIKFCDNLQLLQKLESLRISFRDTPIQDDAVDNILNLCRGLSSLIRLELGLSNTKMTKEVLEHLRNDIKNLPHITHVDLF